MANGIRTGDPWDSIKDVVRSSVEIPKKKAGKHISRNIVEIIIKMMTIVQKPLMIASLNVKQSQNTLFIPASTTRKHCSTHGNKLWRKSSHNNFHSIKDSSTTWQDFLSMINS